MKTNIEVLDLVYVAVKDLFPSCPVYKQIKPDSETHDLWIVINALPINEGILQTCSVNVNIHVKDLEKGKPNFEKIKYMSDELLSGLPFVITEPTMHVYFGRQALIREIEFQTHYSNIQLNCYILNN